MRYLIAAAAVALAAPLAAQDHAEGHHGKGQDAEGHQGMDHVRDTAMFTQHHGKELAAALANTNRDADRARDPYRHPAETLTFFHVGPHMKVGEYAPGGGWYSRVLGNYLNDKGQLVGLFFTPDDGVFNEESRAGIAKGVAEFPAKVEGWTGRPAAQTSALSLDAISDADKGTFDRVLVVRMMHNMMRWNFADSELKALRGLLKDDGLLGIVQHRAKADASGDYANGTKGYLREKDVIAYVEAMGFELVGKSDVNANPNDTADHAEGVWEMPPTLATKREDLKGKGESDRMTLLFRKR